MKQSTLRGGLGCGLVLGWASVGCAAAPRFAVEAGPVDRTYTPVAVEIALPAERMDEPCCVVSDGQTVPAQFEPIGDGKARLWWIVSDLPAGRSRTYQLAMDSACADPATPAFAWKDSSTSDTKSIDLLYGGRPVLRYVYTPFDARSEETIEHTKKPFHHVFDPDGSRLITKGPGGLYPHHRGIFFGHNRIQAEGGPYDLWHCGHGDHQLHTRTLATWTGPVMGGHLVEIKWNNRNGQTLATERRRVVAFAAPDGEILIELSTTVEAADGPVVLASSNCHHGGVQFRAAQEVAENDTATRYLRPKRWADLPTDKEAGTNEKTGQVFRDLPWNAIIFPLGDTLDTVAYLTDPANPDGAEFSERLYGRFGEYFPWELSKERPMHARYRWWVVADRPVTRGQVRRAYEDLADPPRVALHAD